MSHEGLLLHQIPWGIQGQSFQLVDTGVPAKDDSDFSWGFAWDKECSGSVSHLYWPFYSGSWAPLQSLEWTPNRWPLTWLTLLLGFPLPLLMKRLYFKNEFPLYLNRQKSYLFHFLQFSSVPFSRSVVSDSLQPHESQHAMPPCPSQTPGVYSNSCLLSRWCHPATSSSVAHFSSCPQSLQASGSFPMRTPRMRWPKYWSFSFSTSPSNEHPGLISFMLSQIQLPYFSVCDCRESRQK